MMILTDIISPKSDPDDRWDKLDISYMPLILDLDLGNGTMFTIITFCAVFQFKFFVGVERKGCFLFNSPPHPGFEISPKYVAEKLNLCMADANNLSDWINFQFSSRKTEFGTYDLIEGDKGKIDDEKCGLHNKI